jgi:anti-sigma regulatory factor (Ser/Thr protein kinase)
LNQLVEECRALASLPPDEVCSTLLERLDPAARGDDSVVLVVRLALQRAPLAITVPATAHAARTVREPLRRWLAEQGVPTEPAGDVLVAAGEAVANAITHAYPAGRRGPIHVSAVAVDDAVLVRVRDEGQWRPKRDSRGMGLRLIDVLGHGEVASTPEGTVVSIRYERTSPNGSRV